MKYLALLCLLTGCATHTAPELCRHRWRSVKAALAEKYGEENVIPVRLENYDKSAYTYHMQVKVIIDGEDWWAECPSATIELLPYHNPKCKPPRAE